MGTGPNGRLGHGNQETKPQPRESRRWPVKTVVSAVAGSDLLPSRSRMVRGVLVRQWRHHRHGLVNSIQFSGRLVALLLARERTRSRRVRYSVLQVRGMRTRWSGRLMARSSPLGRARVRKAFAATFNIYIFLTCMCGGGGAGEGAVAVDVAAALAVWGVNRQGEVSLCVGVWLLWHRRGLCDRQFLQPCGLQARRCVLVCIISLGRNGERVWSGTSHSVCGVVRRECGERLVESERGETDAVSQSNTILDHTPLTRLKYKPGRAVAAGAAS